jgi:hypothetical protein
MILTVWRAVLALLWGVGIHALLVLLVLLAARIGIHLLVIMPMPIA